MIRTQNLFGVVALSCLLVLLGAPSVKAQWHFPVIPGPSPNSATSLGGDCVELTSQTINTRGVVWDSTQLDLSQPFDISLSTLVGPNSPGFGADGMALVLQRQGLNAYGPGGNALGFGGALPPDPFYTAITPSIAFELDTWGNQGAGVADISTHHIAIHQNGNMAATLAGPTPANANSATVNDSVCHTFRVIWNPTTQNIRIFYPTATNLRLNANIDMINTVFGGNTNVWWGLTAVSGGVAQRHVVCVGADFAYAGTDTAVCPGQPVQLNASGGVEYFWGLGFPVISNQFIANPVFNTLVPAPYDLNVLVTNRAGCTDRDTMRVTVEFPAFANAGSNGQVCLGDSILLGGTPNNNYSYTWSPSGNLNGPTDAQPWFIPTATGGTNLQLIVVDTAGLAGCSDTATVSITANDTPAVAMTTVPNPICAGAQTVVSANASGGSGSYGYQWSPGGATTASITVNPSVTTTYTVTVTDANTCSTIGSVAVTVLPSPTVTATATPDTICAGQQTVLASSPSSGTAPYAFAWSSGGVTQNDTVSPQATNTFTVTVTDANGCTGTASAQVVVNVSDSIDIMVPDTFVCNVGAINISNTFSTPGVDTWSWSPSLGVSPANDPNPLITPPTSTTYFLSGFNSLTGCGYIDSIRIDVFDLEVNGFVDSTICLGDSVSFNLQPAGGSGNYTYVWLGSPAGYISDDSIGNPVVRPTVTTTYNVIVTDAITSCQTIYSVIIRVNPLIVTATPGAITINPGQHVQMEAFGAATYVWTPDSMINCATCQNPTAAPTGSITYTVTGTDTSGCIGTATVRIIADSLQIPNVFSPNGDGINDVLFFNYYGPAFYQIAVYDRWGVRLFNTTDKTAMWNGKTNGGADAPEGVYYVAVQIVGDNAIPEKDKQKVFAVTLLR